MLARKYEFYVFVYFMFILYIFFVFVFFVLCFVYVFKNNTSLVLPLEHKIHIFSKAAYSGLQLVKLFAAGAR